MSSGSPINRDDAEIIANKLEARLTEGQRHTIAVIFYGDQRIAQFGIRRASHKDTFHGYIPRQLGVPQGFVLKISECTKGRDDYLGELRKRGRIT